MGAYLPYAAPLDLLRSTFRVTALGAQRFSAISRIGALYPRGVGSAISIVTSNLISTYLLIPA